MQIDAMTVLVTALLEYFDLYRLICLQFLQTVYNSKIQSAYINVIFDYMSSSYKHSVNNLQPVMDEIIVS